MIVEICANSCRSAAHAKAGGADRIELCRQLEVGGTTPTPEEIAYCVHELGIRTHVLVRPRAGDFVYDDHEFAAIEREVAMCRRAGAQAVVVGFLTPEGCIDECRTRRIVELARPMEVTFHRAFDEICQPPEEALEAVIGCGCHRLLTSGCRPTAEEGIETLKTLGRRAAGRIIILAGAGVTPRNVRRILQDASLTEIHGSCKRTLSDGTMETDPEIVRELVRQVGALR